MRRDSLEGEARDGVTLRMSAVTGGGVPGMESNRAQALGRGPSVARVRAGRRFVEEARWRIGGGDREAIISGERGGEEKRETDGRMGRVDGELSRFVLVHKSDWSYGNLGCRHATREQVMINHAITHSDLHGTTTHPRPSRHPRIHIRHSLSHHSPCYVPRHRSRCPDHHPRRTQLPPQQRGTRSTIPVTSRLQSLFILPDDCLSVPRNSLSCPYFRRCPDRSARFS
jgi:hypothetical protein